MKQRTIPESAYVVVPFEHAIPTQDEIEAFGRQMALLFITMEIHPGDMIKMEKA